VVAFLGGPAVPEGQVPLPLSALAKHCRRNRVPSARIIGIGLNPSVHFVHRWTEWTAVDVMPIRGKELAAFFLSRRCLKRVKKSVSGLVFFGQK